MVEAYGSTVPLNQVAAVSVPEPRADHRQRLGQGPGRRRSRRPIRAAGLGLNPVVDGQNLRMPIPPLTEERRKDLAKLAGKYAEQQKHRRPQRPPRRAMEDLKKAGEGRRHLPRTSRSRWATRSRASPTTAVKRIDEALKTKEQEIMQV